MSASPLVSSSLFSDLAADFDGELILPGAAEYDATRAVWNGMIDRRPACIAICKNVADVRRAVLFARANDITLGVRGGGHNAARPLERRRWAGDGSARHARRRRRPGA